MPLTAITVKKAKPKDKSYKLADAGGLYLLVQPNGAKYWRLKYRVAGKEKTLACGVYPEVSLEKARRFRDAARSQLKEGLDPGLIKKQRKQEQQDSFAQLAREWHTNQKGGWTEDHAKRVLESLEADVFPYLGSRPFRDIEPPEVLEVVRRIEKRGALDVASRVLQRIRSVFRYAIQSGRAKHNPAAELAGALRTRKVEHRAALTRAELPEFWNKLSKYDGQPLTRLALQLVVLTFVRTNELRGAEWNEFDLDRAEWRIPASRMKMRAGHIVPLSTQALDVLEELKAHTGDRRLVFPGQNDRNKPMSQNTMIYAMYRMGYHNRGTVHGFRATASTILNEHGFNRDVIERQLAHVERNKVRAAYHRSEYLEDRRKMMQWWGDFIDSLAGVRKIVPFKRA